MKKLTVLTPLLVLIFLLLMVINSCGKHDAAATRPVSIQTRTATNITDTSAETGGITSVDVGLDKGVCYSVNPNPTADDSRAYADAAGGDGSFSLTIKGLSRSTTYHARAYCFDHGQIVYGQDISFTTALGPIITTIAGTGEIGYNGNNIPALSAQFHDCTHLALDHAGNVYFADEQNQIVRKLTISTGIITNIAGTAGVSGFSGDNGPAVNATINEPAGLAIDANDNLFFADKLNNRIRKIDAGTGIITTVVGGAVLNAPYGDGGPAIAACLDVPYDVKLDANGNIFIVDRGHSRIRRVDATTHIISNYAGGGATLGDGVPATSVIVNSPIGLAITSSGEVLISCAGRIRKVTTAGTIITVAGNGTYNAVNNVPATESGMTPFGIATDAGGNIYIADKDNNTVRKVNAAGVISIVAGGHYYTDFTDNVPPLLGSLSYPVDVTLDASGNLYIVDYGEERTRKVIY